MKFEPDVPTKGRQFCSAASAAGAQTVTIPPVGGATVTKAPVSGGAVHGPSAGQAGMTTPSVNPPTARTPGVPSPSVTAPNQANLPAAPNAQGSATAVKKIEADGYKNV